MAPRSVSVPLYAVARSIAAVLAGAIAALSGLAVAVALALNFAGRAGAPLPGTLGDAAWSGYLLAWLGTLIATPFAALLGGLAGGRAGRAALAGGAVWLVGMALTAFASASVPVLPTVVMVAAPLIAGGGALAAGFGLLGRHSDS